jgi:hypothetical protein
MRQTALQSPPRHTFAAATAEIAKLLGGADDPCGQLCSPSRAARYACHSIWIRTTARTRLCNAPHGGVRRRVVRTPPSTECVQRRTRPYFRAQCGCCLVGLRHARCMCLRVCSAGHACADQHRRHKPADALADDLCADAGTDLCADAWADVIADGSRRCAPSAFDAAEQSPSGVLVSTLSILPREPWTRVHARRECCAAMLRRLPSLPTAVPRGTF